NPDLAILTSNLFFSPYEVSENWKSIHKVDVVIESQLIQGAVSGAINNLRMKRIVYMIDERFELLKNIDTEEERNALLEGLVELINVKKSLSEALGIVVVR
ncbi:MAG: hypothetical protein WCL14_14280, partial [Bacteroidota bacterium]